MAYRKAANSPKKQAGASSRVSKKARLSTSKETVFNMDTGRPQDRSADSEVLRRSTKKQASKNLRNLGDDGSGGDGNGYDDDDEDEEEGEDVVEIDDSVGEIEKEAFEKLDNNSKQILVRLLVEERDDLEASFQAMVDSGEIENRKPVIEYGLESNFEELVRKHCGPDKAGFKKAEHHKKVYKRRIRHIIATLVHLVGTVNAWTWLEKKGCTQRIGDLIQRASIDEMVDVMYDATTEEARIIMGKPGFVAGDLLDLSRLPPDLLDRQGLYVDAITYIDPLTETLLDLLDVYAGSATSQSGVWGRWSTGYANPSVDKIVVSNHLRTALKRGALMNLRGVATFDRELPRRDICLQRASWGSLNRVWSIDQQLPGGFGIRKCSNPNCRDTDPDSKYKSQDSSRPFLEFLCVACHNWHKRKNELRPKAQCDKTKADREASKPADGLCERAGCVLQCQKRLEHPRTWTCKSHWKDEKARRKQKVKEMIKRREDAQPSRPTDDVCEATEKCTQPVSKYVRSALRCCCASHQYGENRWNERLTAAYKDMTCTAAFCESRGIHFLWSRDASNRYLCDLCFQEEESRKMEPKEMKSKPTKKRRAGKAGEDEQTERLSLATIIQTKAALFDERDDRTAQLSKKRRRAPLADSPSKHNRQSFGGPPRHIQDEI
ncbi:Hypothetical protein D9617_2g058410 [Elsinoe fawcettii]|nr:Hypothetical protein D9617_2g058410 [Elsinoe fawcettii]